MKYTHYVEIDRHAASGLLALVIQIPTRLHQRVVLDEPDGIEYLMVSDNEGIEPINDWHIVVPTYDAFTNFADAAKDANDFNLMRQNATNAD